MHETIIYSFIFFYFFCRAFETDNRCYEGKIIVYTQTIFSHKNYKVSIRFVYLGCGRRMQLFALLQYLYNNVFECVQNCVNVMCPMCDQCLDLVRWMTRCVRRSDEPRVSSSVEQTGGGGSVSVLINL